MSAALRSQRRTVLLNEHEAFWIDCLRVACPNGVRAPTLARAQALRRLFTRRVPLEEHEEPGDGQP